MQINIKTYDPYTKLKQIHVYNTKKNILSHLTLINIASDVELSNQR